MYRGAPAVAVQGPLVLASRRARGGRAPGRHVLLVSMVKSPPMTSPARGVWQTPEEVIAALRERGMRLSAPISVKAGKVPPMARSIEAIARFMSLGGGICAVTTFESP